MMMRVANHSRVKGFWLVLGFAIVVFASSGAAQEAAPAVSAAKPAPPAFSPVAVQAAYLMNFIRFTTWPEERENALKGPWIIGVANNRPLEDELLRISEGQVLRGRRLRVVRIRSARDFEECHVIWAGPASNSAVDFPITLGDSLSQVRGRSLLTVSDTPGFLAEGGMVELYREGESLRFAIDARAARAEGLELSSRLLALSRSVAPKPGEITFSSSSPAP